MAKTFRPYDPDQLLMLPPSLREWLPPDHLVYFVSDVVDELDLSEIFDTYQEERGYPPYHPALMTKLLIYGYTTGVYSSRRISRHCQEDVAFRILCAGDAPDFRTVAAFRKRHLKALGGLFVEVLKVCQRAGLVKLGHVAIDGTKIKANASKHKAMSYGRMQSEDVRLTAEVAALLKEAETTDAEEDVRYGQDRRGDELPEELRHRESRLQKIREAKAALEQQVREEAAAAGEEKADEAVPAENAQRNFTDPESRIMLGSDRAFLQGYNAQAAVDAGHQVIVAAEVVQQASDQGMLLPMVEQMLDMTGDVPEAVSADAGYWKETDLGTLEWYEIPAYVAPGRIKHHEWRQAPVLPEEIPAGLSRKAAMRHRLHTESGRRAYDKRKVTVEPVFGQIKAAKGFRQFLLRGLAQVQEEWRIVCTAHNLRKLYVSGWRPV